MPPRTSPTAAADDAAAVARCDVVVIAVDQALVLADELRHRLLASARALAPIELLREPALSPPVRGPRMSPHWRARTWMRRCAELAAPDRIWQSDVESVARR